MTSLVKLVLLGVWNDRSAGQLTCLFSKVKATRICPAEAFLIDTTCSFYPLRLRKHRVRFGAVAFDGLRRFTLAARVLVGRHSLLFPQVKAGICLA